MEPLVRNRKMQNPQQINTYWWSNDYFLDLKKAYNEDRLMICQSYPLYGHFTSSDKLDYYGWKNGGIMRLLIDHCRVLEGNARREQERYINNIQNILLLLAQPDDSNIDDACKQILMINCVIIHPLIFKEKILLNNDKLISDWLKENK